MDKTSFSLLRRLADPNDDAWFRFHKLYLPFIMKEIQRFPRLASCADDIAQDVLVAVQKSIPEFERQRDGSFRAWLRQTTRHRILSALRVEKRFPALIDFTEEISNQLYQWTDSSSDASQLWDAEHDKTLLKHVLGLVRLQVSEVDWRAFESYALRGESPAQVAAQLEVEINVVYLAKSRILKKIRQLLYDMVENPAEFLKRRKSGKSSRGGK